MRIPPPPTLLKTRKMGLAFPVYAQYCEGHL